MDNERKSIVKYKDDHGLTVRETFPEGTEAIRGEGIIETVTPAEFCYRLDIPDGIGDVFAAKFLAAAQARGLLRRDDYTQAALPIITECLRTAIKLTAREIQQKLGQ